MKANSGFFASDIVVPTGSKVKKKKMGINVSRNCLVSFGEVELL